MSTPPARQTTRTRLHQTISRGAGMSMKSEDIKQGAPGTGAAMLDNPQLYNLVIHRIGSEVVGRLWRRFIVLLAGILVPLGFIATTYHNTVIEKQANAAVNNVIGELMEKVESASLSLELTQLVDLIDEGESFSEEQKNATINLLERATKLKSFPESETFLVQIERLLDALTAADVRPEIDKLEEMYGDKFVDSAGIVAMLIQHYGYRILSAPTIRKTSVCNDNSNDIARYKKYVSLAKPRGYPELYIFFEMIIEDSILQECGDVDVQEVIKEIDHINEIDSRNLWQMVKKYAANEISIKPTPETNRVSKRTIDFLEKYENVRPEFQSILNEIK